MFKRVYVMFQTSEQPNNIAARRPKRKPTGGKTKKPTKPRADKYVRMSQELHTELKAQCARRGVTMQSLVERLVRRELAKS